MYKKIYFWLIIIVIVVACFLQWFFCCRGLSAENNDANVVVAETKIKQKVVGLPFVLKDSMGNFSVKSNDNFNFKKSSFDYEKPLSEDLSSKIDLLKDFLVKDESKGLAITGLYGKAERNTSMYPNLGIARANNVKNYFISKGIPSNVINIFGKENNDIPFDDQDILYGPVGFEIAEIQVENKDEIAQLLSEIKENPLVLNFEYNSSEMNLSDKQRDKMLKIARYLDKVNDAKCLVIGYSDDKGAAEDNLVLAQKRADFAKECLIKNAILASKIETKAKGEVNPVASNKTEAGRAKNRRTEITIK